MPDVQFETYYRYDELTRVLQAFAEEYPQLLHLESIGKSYEGRDIWLATVTNFETGDAIDFFSSCGQQDDRNISFFAQY